MGNSEFDLSESGGHGRCMMKETKQEKTKRGWFKLEQGAAQVTTTDSVRDSNHATALIKKRKNVSRNLVSVSCKKRAVATKS